MIARADLVEREGERLERLLARPRATPEERARIVASVPPFDYDAWAREAGPPTPDELAEMEELLQEREEERQRSLECEEHRLARSSLPAALGVVEEGRPQ
jgi:hypothetical protein